jgi:uncharacterized membrane protein YdfJ with MMPL/SSD domain
MRHRATVTEGTLERLGRAVIRFRWAVLAAWLVIVVASGMAASGLPDLFKSQLALPGTDSQRAEEVLQREFGQKGVGAFTLVARTEGPAVDLLPELRRAAGRAAQELPTGKVASVRPVSERVAAAEIVSRLDPMEADEHVAAMRAAAGTIAGAESWLTGTPAINATWSRCSRRT